MAITTVKIFPSIGIARLGNSPDGFLIGPELPGAFDPPEDGYKDLQCRIKRQAARFRIFGYEDAGGSPVEITLQNVHAINWTVQLANKKSSWKCIFPLLYEQGKLRNRDVPSDQRGALNIKPAARSLSGANQGPSRFDDGTFQKMAQHVGPDGAIVDGPLATMSVPLGEIRTDELGRLLVLGGFGKSGGVESIDHDESDKVIAGYPELYRTFNTAGWYDDVSDGPITATITLTPGAQPLVAAPAWVICAPPDYAPEIVPLTTLWDVLRQRAIDEFSSSTDLDWLRPPKAPSFADDVQPILERVRRLQWVSNVGRQGNDKHHTDVFAAAAPPISDLQARSAIFSSLKPPGVVPGFGQTANMPLLWGDNYPGNPVTVLTQTQYSILEAWKDVEWSDPGPLPSSFRPEDLTRAALQGCVGGALCPGIEATRSLRDEYTFSEPFRIDHTSTGADGELIAAGDLTKGMSCPWQTDFFMCQVDQYPWWPSQRPDDVYPEDLLAPGNSPPASWTARPWIQDLVDPGRDPGRGQMIENWSRLGFIVRRGDVFVETERDTACAGLFLILDRTRVAKSEIGPKLPTVFDNAFYVVLEGLSPAGIGISSEADLAADAIAAKQIAPTITALADGTALSDVKVPFQQLLLEVQPFDPNAVQRLTFAYGLEFDGVAAFASSGDRKVTLLANKNLVPGVADYSDAGTLTLAVPASPYMLDGKTSWLSDDIRVFKVVAGDPALPGLPPFIPPADDDEPAWAAAATAHIAAVVKALNLLGPDDDPFGSLPSDQQFSALELSEKVGTGTAMRRVLNFAIARVRYRGVDPASARVFFRLFTTAATGTDYDELTSYRRSSGTKPVAVPGLLASNVVTIPCYGEVRAADPYSQADPLNVVDFAGDPAAAEVWRFAGCWLDFNQTTKMLAKPTVPGELFSIQDLIRGLHQCLVVEIFFDGGEIPTGATPGDSDSLAQRNLAIVESDNPGGPATRTLQHSFEVKATKPGLRPIEAAAVLADRVRSAYPLPIQADELMIRWGTLPRTAGMTIYLPDIEAAEIVSAARRSYAAQQLEPLDAHTVRCLPGDVTYVPLPGPRKRNSPALLTITLPEGVRRGQRFDVVVHQLSDRPRRAVGAFQLSIPVSDRRALLAPEARTLSVMRHIARSIAPDDPWSAVFVRYLGWLAERVRGFGGNPDDIVATADGSGVDPSTADCARRVWLVGAVLTLLLLVLGFHPLPGYLAEVLVAVAAAIVVRSWIAHCRPTPCHVIFAVALGVVMGGALLAIAWLAGLADARAMVIVAASTVVLAGLALVGRRWRCTPMQGLLP